MRKNQNDGDGPELIPDLVFMEKNNWTETAGKFDRWWNREEGLRLIVADVAAGAPRYSGMDDYADYRTNLEKHIDFFVNKSFHGEVFPDMGPYLGPGSLAVFLGSEPIYSDKTIWFRETTKSLTEIRETCERLLVFDTKTQNDEFNWYRWTMDSAEYYSKMAEERYKPSMPDLQQNLDVLSAVMGPERLLMELHDDQEGIMKTLDLLFRVWEKVFFEISDVITDRSGYTAYTHYNLLGRGRTSVLQSDISCMLSGDMFRQFEIPYLAKQCRVLDNVLYHLDGPGAVRHLDDILAIEEINAIQWVPGSGEPGNADSMYFDMYDKITGAGKGLYLYINPEELDGFLERYHDKRILVRTRVENEEEQIRLIENYS